LRLAPVALLFLGGLVVWAGLALRDAPQSGFQPPSREGIPVVFHLEISGARSIAVIGTFNRWRGEGYEMHWDGQTGRWVLAASLPAGRHEYAFLVDGRLIVPDPGASLYQEDGFGNRNAVLILGNGNGQHI
jgi:1,4-alpha-glucan branching enzyme